MPPIRITNVCPAATNPTNEATSRIGWMPLDAGEPGPDDAAEHEQRDRGDEPVEDPRRSGLQREPERARSAERRPDVELIVRLRQRPTEQRARTTATTRNSPW